MNAESCETCRYWTSVCAQSGQCRRFPPAYIGPHDGGEYALNEAKLWPLTWDQPWTSPRSWCGEFDGGRK